MRAEPLEAMELDMGALAAPEDASPGAPDAALMWNCAPRFAIQRHQIVPLLQSRSSQPTLSVAVTLPQVGTIQE